VIFQGRARIYPAITEGYGKWFREGLAVLALGAEKLEEIPHTRRLALVTKRADPVRVHRAGPRPGLAARNHPLQPARQPPADIEFAGQRLATDGPDAHYCRRSRARLLR
jgi:hypothetical protein